MVTRNGKTRNGTIKNMARKNSRIQTDANGRSVTIPDHMVEGGKKGKIIAEHHETYDLELTSGKIVSVFKCDVEE